MANTHYIIILGTGNFIKQETIQEIISKEVVVGTRMLVREKRKESSKE